MNKRKLRYTLVIAYWEYTMICDKSYNIFLSRILKTEEVDYSNLKEAVECATVLSKKEATMSYIFDNVRNKKLTLKGEE